MCHRVVTGRCGCLVVESAKEWKPVNERQHPPFQPGNQVSVGNRGHMANGSHGAYSPRRVNPLTKDIIKAHIEADPDLAYLQEPKYAASVWAWARSEAQVQLVTEYVEDMGIDAAMSPKPGTTAAIELLRRLEVTAATHRARLGLDPLSFARLGKDVVATRVMARNGLDGFIQAGAEFARRDSGDMIDGSISDDD